MNEILVTQVSSHVVQFAIPTPTLPPALSTNTYLVFAGETGLLVDAGVTEEHFLRELTGTVAGLGVAKVQLLATHYHCDHTQGFPWLQARYRTPILLHPLDTPAALREMGISQNLVAPAPDTLRIGNVEVKIDSRPGHTHGHLHVRIYPDKVALVGDHVAGTGSVWIGPPDGHLSSYYAALDSVIDGDCEIVAPGHGPVLQDGRKAVLQQKRHRMDRERQILSHLSDWKSIDQLLALIYAGQVPPQALGVARKTIQANLQYFLEHGRIRQRFDNRRRATLYRKIP